MSYGPGRYDPNYEEKGIDYPYAYVPFTEQRNMETFLQLVKEGKVTPSRLITHRFRSEAEKAYEMIKTEESDKYLGVVFTYPEESVVSRRVDLKAGTQNYFRRLCEAGDDRCRELCAADASPPSLQDEGSGTCWRFHLHRYKWKARGEKVWLQILRDG